MLKTVVTVKVDLGPLKNFAASIKADLHGGTGPVHQALKQWAVRYAGFVKDRFDRYSKGLGDWTPLAESTIKRRRKGKGSKKFKKGSVSILRDTGALFASVNPMFSGTTFQARYHTLGVDVGFGGSEKHPTSDATLVDIASYHQFGGPNLPKREILTLPDQSVIDAMKGDMARALEKLAKQTKSV